MDPCSMNFLSKKDFSTTLLLPFTHEHMERWKDSSKTLNKAEQIASLRRKKPSWEKKCDSRHAYRLPIHTAPSYKGCPWERRWIILNLNCREMRRMTSYAAENEDQREQSAARRQCACEATKSKWSKPYAPVFYVECSICASQITASLPKCQTI